MTPPPPTMQLKFKPGEETSVIEGLQAEVPGRPPSHPPLACAVHVLGPSASSILQPKASTLPPLPQPAHLKEDKLSHPRRAILAAEKAWAGYFGSRKTLGGLFWPPENLGPAIWAAEKLGRALFWLREKQCACAHSGNLTYRRCIFDT